MHDEDGNGDDGVCTSSSVVVVALSWNCIWMKIA